MINHLVPQMNAVLTEFFFYLCIKYDRTAGKVGSIHSNIPPSVRPEQYLFFLRLKVLSIASYRASNYIMASKYQIIKNKC
jgi:hypothetical protein